jgi:hypothetical protein
MSYQRYEPQQQMLLPKALQDWLPEGHLAYFVGDAIYGLNLSAFHARCEAGGSSNQLHENGQGQCRAPQGDELRLHGQGGGRTQGTDRSRVRSSEVNR